ncbi:DUF6875 domain-containing protein [Streptomyces sp. NPDC049954]|uniref:DUF6875 domain-containing protein n=1 Tax=Streptomyces sp. NPDC049954 TaxID=3155779 RepID=UPI00341202B2
MATLCPYLAPSLHRGLTTWTVYEIASSDAAAVEAGLFHAGAQAAEWLRPLLTRPGGALRCENVVVLGEVPGTTHRALMGWPHWALKNLYGPVGVMFGKFYAGEEERTRAGARVPAAPASFLPVRAAIRRRDPRFLEDATPVLAAALATAEDDGRDLLADIGADWKEVRAWARTLLPPLKPSASSPAGSANASTHGC